MEILRTDNLDTFDHLWRQHFDKSFPLPSIKNCTQARDIMEGDKHIASGFVKLLSEAIIVTDQNLSTRDRKLAIDLLMKDLIAWCKDKKVEQIHAFVNEDFARILRRHYQFHPINAIPLVLNLE